MAYAIGFHDIHIDPWTEQVGWMKEWMETMYKIGGDKTHAFTIACMRTEQADWLLSVKLDRLTSRTSTAITSATR